MSMIVVAHATETGLPEKEFWTCFDVVEFGKKPSTALVKTNTGNAYEVMFESDANMLWASFEMPLSAAADNEIWTALYELMSKGYAIEESGFIALADGKTLDKTQPSHPDHVDYDNPVINHPETPDALMKFITGEEDADNIDNPELHQIFLSRGFKPMRGESPHTLGKNLFDKVDIKFSPSCRLMDTNATWDKTSGFTLDIVGQDFALLFGQLSSDCPEELLPFKDRNLGSNPDGYLIGSAASGFCTHPVDENTEVQGAGTYHRFGDLLDHIDAINDWATLRNSIFIGMLSPYGIIFQGIWIYLYTSYRAGLTIKQTQADFDNWLVNERPNGIYKSVALKEEQIDAFNKSLSSLNL